MVILDLACGQRKHEGAIGVDKYKTDCTDVVHDLLTYPWPFEDDSVDQILCSHFLEHIPGRERPRFMEEVWRVLKVGGVAAFSVPPWNSERAYQDYTHEWPPLAPASIAYFDKNWREKNQLTHGDYDIKCNFDVVAGSNMKGDWKGRTHEVQKWASQHYVNTVDDLVFNLTKREM